MQDQSQSARVTLFDGLKARPARPATKPQVIGGEDPMSPLAAAEVADPGAQGMRAALLARRRPLIEAALEAIRPNLQRDGGDCQLVKLEGDAVYIRLSGACVGCQLASVTIHGVRQKLIEAIGMPLRVIPVN
ncbi:NifU family protein [Rhizobium sp. KAs_5_22]|uniref:NifU family protein n=1 Tax=Ciceribacter selenitireducens TaxID=448181 RepID=UPI0004B5C626|nr:NifU family protein [Ciceribacter selenitireducens]PPJ49295.1 NifU family protein [Rhizobium sp. KAs_5_22]